MEQDNLPITTSNTNFIISNGLNPFYTLSTYILSKYKHFIFDLETAKVSTHCSCE